MHGLGLAVLKIYDLRYLTSFLNTTRSNIIRMRCRPSPQTEIVKLLLLFEETKKQSACTDEI